MPDPIELWKAAGQTQISRCRGGGYKNADANTNTGKEMARV